MNKLYLFRYKGSKRYLSKLGSGLYKLVENAKDAKISDKDILINRILDFPVYEPLTGRIIMCSPNEFEVVVFAENIYDSLEKENEYLWDKLNKYRKELDKLILTHKKE